MKYYLTALIIGITTSAAEARHPIVTHNRSSVVHLAPAGALIMTRRPDGTRYFTNVDFTAGSGGSKKLAKPVKPLPTDRSTRAPGTGAAVYGGGPLWIQNPFATQSRD